MYSKIAPIAKHYSVCILSLWVVTNSTCWIFRRKGKIGLRYVLGLLGSLVTWLEQHAVLLLTKSNHSFSKRSITISKVSNVILSNWSFFLSAFTDSSQAWSNGQIRLGNANIQTWLSHLVRPYHTPLELPTRFPVVLSVTYHQYSWAPCHSKLLTYVANVMIGSLELGITIIIWRAQSIKNSKI